jgi:histidine triad (HIT) family protein
MSTIFTKIIQGEIPCFKVAETATFFAFLDIRPVAFGHTLVVPKKEVDYIFDMEDDELGEMFLFAKKVSRVLEHHVTCERVGVSVIGLEVPHTHVHLIPIRTLQDMNFSADRYVFDKGEYEILSAKLFSTFTEWYGSGE